MTKLEAEEYGKLRKYPIGSGYFSVTSIINYVFGVPPEIVKWSVKESARAIYDALKDAEKKGIKRPTKASLLEIGETERIRLLKEAGKKGTAVHDYAEKLGNGDSQNKKDNPYEKYYEAVEDFFTKEKPKIILQEKVVVSHKYEFAGRFDCYCELWGRKVLLDYKTSNFVRSEYGLQLAAYAHCLRSAGIPVEKQYILHLQSSGKWEIVEFCDTFSDFLVVREAFKRKAAIEKPEFNWASDVAAVKEEQTKN